MWTNENTLVAVGYVALIVFWWSLAAFVDRKRIAAAQVDVVKQRLTEPRKPTYKTVVQMNSDGSLISFKSLFQLKVGEAVTVDIASGMICSYVQGARPIGLVVASEVSFE